MAVNTVFLMVCFIALANCFTFERFEDKRSTLGNEQAFALTGYDRTQQNSEESSQYRNEKWAVGREDRLRDGKVKIRYSSSSEEKSKESFEISQVQKQYHDTVPHDNGNGRLVHNQVQPRIQKVMNLEDHFLQDELHNTIHRKY